MDEFRENEPEEDSRQLHRLSRAMRHVAVRIAHGLPVTMGGRRRRQENAYASGLLGAFSRYTRAYFQRWLLIGVLIGIVAGIGAIVFASAISVCTQWLLTGIAGFKPPAPAGEGVTTLTPIAHRWLIPVVTTLGGLLTGLIVFTLAPEAEGHGTDAAIESFHEKGGRIRSRIPIIKLVASAITIGSGGSAGREGPTAQISAGFGSWLGDLLHLDEHDRRIAVAAGIGSGIGAIFKAPFGGALLSAEILYKRDFEADALFPSFIASVIGFTIYGAWAGWTPVFGLGGHYSFTHASSLLGYLILGICAGLVGLLYPKTLYGIRGIFHRIHIPNHFKPAIGGLLVGIIGLFIPQALGMGYGYVQFGINSDYLHVAAWLMAVLVFVKILTTSLTIGSGGSGGVFGPGMVIGGFLGSALWAGIHALAPGLVAGTNAGAFAVVGMGAFFGGIAKAPLAVILMVAEMTGEYSLIAPAMLATMVAYLITGDTSIYESQVPTRLDSPAHKNDYALPLLQSLTVRDAMISGVEGALATATPDTPLPEMSKLMRERRVASIPILDKGRLVGMVTAVDLARMEPEEAEVSRARQVMTRAVIRAVPDESLYKAWLRMSRRGLRQLAVVDPAEPTRLVGVLTADAIGQILRPRRSAAPAAAHPEIPQMVPVPETSMRERLAGATANIGSTGSMGVTADGYGGPTLSEGLALDVEEDEDEADEAAQGPAGVTTATRPDAVVPGANGMMGASTTIGTEAATGVGQQAPAAIAGKAGDPLSLVKVADAMLKTPRLVRASDAVTTARRLLEVRGNALMVVDAGGKLVGIVTRSDLASRSDVEQNRALTVGDVMVRNLVTARPGESLRVAIHRMSALELRQLPVVAGDLSAKPLGLLRRSDILAAYERMQGSLTP